MLAEGKPFRYDLIGVLVCLIGIAIIMYAPRSSQFAQAAAEITKTSVKKTAPMLAFCERFR